MATWHTRDLSREELAETLAEVDPAVVLTSRSVVRQVIRHDRGILGFASPIPHDACYAVATERLLELVSRERLRIGPARSLPETTILLAEPEDEDPLDRHEGLVHYWRLLFHARVHTTLEARWRAGELPLAELKERVRRIGPAEWEEVVTVLGEEHYLLPPADVPTAYFELAAVYLELTYFARTLVPSYFPSLGESRGVVRLLEAEVGAAALFESCRPPGAPDPEAPTETTSEEPQAYFRKLVGEAEEVEASGNLARAAILRTRAARVAPADREGPTRRRALDAVRAMVGRLQDVLGYDDEAAASWNDGLAALVDKADQGLWPQEARLLYDLQKACVDGRRDFHRFGSLGGLLRGRLREPLPYQPEILTCRHLSRAQGRLPAVRLHVHERAQLGALFKDGLERVQGRLRQRLRPLLEADLTGSGLRPRSGPERVVFVKIVDELLDRLTTRWFLTFSDLRDALSSYQLKLGDLAFRDVARGDTLLRVDRRLRASLVGLYRSAEVYRRGLQRLSSLLGATRPGRFLVWYALLPLLGAYGLLVATAHLLEVGSHWLTRGEPEGTGLTLTEPVQVGAVAFFLMLVLNQEAVRRTVGRFARLVSSGVRGVFVDLPRAVLGIPAVRDLLQQGLARAVLRFGIKPAVPTALVSWWWLKEDSPLLGFAPAHLLVFLAALVLLNNPWWHRLEERLGDRLVLGWRYLKADFVPRVFRWVMRLFKRLGELLESVFYTVDEWLRFRSDDRRATFVAKALVVPAWAPVSYLLRMTFDLCIEPRINPIKYVSVVMILDKVFLPYTLPMVNAFSGAAESVVGQGPLLAESFGWAAAWALPAMVGFLVWELKENWRLYRANRGRAMGPQPMTLHGETLPRLLRASGHGGGLPGLFSRLRRAEQRAHRTGDWTASRRQRAALEHFEGQVRSFVDREVIRLLASSRAWRPQPDVAGLLPRASDSPRRFQPDAVAKAIREASGDGSGTLADLAIGDVRLGLNRIQVELTRTLGSSHGGGDGEGAAAGDATRRARLELVFADDNGWLAASLEDDGFLSPLTTEQLRALKLVLFRLYKIAGVELVHEQVRACLDRHGALQLRYELEDAGVKVWPADQHEAAARYDPRSPGWIDPRPYFDDTPLALPAMAGSALIFEQVEVSWDDWVRALDRDGPGANGEGLDPERVPLLPPELEERLLASGRPARDGAAPPPAAPSSGAADGPGEGEAGEGSPASARSEASGAGRGPGPGNGQRGAGAKGLDAPPGGDHPPAGS